MHSGLVGVTLPVIHHSYFSEILAGVGEAFYEHEIPMVLCPTLHEHDREVTLLQRLRPRHHRRRAPDPARGVARRAAALQEQGYPFVIVDPRLTPDERVPTVSASHLSGAREATEHLLVLGHRRIAAITGPHGWIATEERLRGYRGALGEAGITPDPALQIDSNFRDNGGRAATQQLLALPDPPTAIFAFNDMMAIGALQAARQCGLRVPEDISVVGFDDTYEASIMYPALTTVRQPLAEMGRMAVAQLVRLLQSQRIEALHVELATKLGRPRHHRAFLITRRDVSLLSGVTSPLSYAKTTICTRSRRSSLARIRPTCDLTVASDSTSRSAISAFERLRATSSSTSRSRAVSCSSRSR